MALRDSPMDEGGALRALEARVAALESANPLQRATVDDGGQTRVAPGGMLLVDGDLMGGSDSNLNWAGFVDFTRRTFMHGGFTANDNSTVNGVFQTNKNVHFKGDGTGGQAEFVVGMPDMSQSDMPVWLHGIAEHTSASGLRALAVNEHNEVFSVPFPTSGGGGDPGGGGDNAKGLIYPFPLSEAGDRWGPRDYAPSPFHRGIDWPKPAGTDIPCSGDGTVIMAENTGDLWGNYIRVDHGDGIWTAYAHMQPGGIYVSVGQAVTRGQIIGGVGTTGPSTGNHLHFEVWIGGERVDPEGYIGPE